MAAPPRDAAARAPGCLAPPPSSAELVIDGMTCGACVRSVEVALARLPPGALLASTVTLGRASVRFAAHLVTAAQIAEGALSAMLPAAACGDAQSVFSVASFSSRAVVEECGFDVRLQCDGAPATPLPADETEDEPLLPAQPRRIQVRSLTCAFSLLRSALTRHRRSCWCRT